MPKKRFALFLIIMVAPVFMLNMVDAVRPNDLMELLIKIFVTTVVVICVLFYGLLANHEGRLAQYEEIRPALRIEED